MWFDFAKCGFYNEVVTENWIEFMLGAALLLAPWMFGFADVPLAKWTDLLSGLVLVLMNLWAIYGNGDAALQGSGEAGAHREDPAVASAVKGRRTRRRTAAKASVTAMAAPRTIQKVENVF